MAVEIGTLRALLSLDSAAFEKGAKRAQASMGNLERSLAKTGERMQSLGRTLTTRVTLPLVAATGLLMRSSIQTAVQIERMSKLANAGAVEFQRFAAGAKDVGIEQDKVADILKDVNDKVGDFLVTGGGPLKDFFEQIAPRVGVTADQFARLSGPEALQLYVSSLEKAGVSQQQMTFFMEALANDATLLLPLLRNNGAEMQRLADRAEDLGAIMDAKTIAALNRANDSMRDLGTVGAGLGNQITAALAPALEALTNALVDVAKWFATLPDLTKQLIGVTTALAAALGPVTLALGLMASGFAAAVGGAKALVVALFSVRGALIATGIGAFVVGIGLAINWIAKLVEKTGSWGAAMDALGQVSAGVWDGIATSAEALVPALDAVFFGIRASWLSLLKAMQIRWTNFLRELADTIRGIPLLDDVALSLSNAAIRAGSGVYELDEALGRAAGTANALKDAAAGMVTLGFDKASQALKRLNALMADTKDGGENTTAAMIDLKNAMNAAATVATSGGGDGGGAGYAASGAGGSIQDFNTELDRTQQLGRNLEYTFESAFTSFVSGASSANDALRNMLNSLANIAASQAFQALLGGGSGGGGGIFGTIAGSLVSGIGGLFGGGGGGGTGGLSFGAAGLGFTPSFDGGGYTGSGPRSGGIDGRGGFPAILHPNETVTDHSRGQQAGGDVTIRLIAPEGFTAQQEGRVHGIAVQVVNQRTPGMINGAFDRAKEERRFS